jgi:hypothetical protein
MFLSVLQSCNDHGNEIQKIPGGGSMQWQAADLMLAHRIIHHYVHSNIYIKCNIQQSKEPLWFPALKYLLVQNNIDAASRKCFERFFYQLPLMLSKAFTVDLIVNGWELSGSSPFNIHTILSKCVNWKTFTNNDQDTIINAVQCLIENSLLSGICSDEDIHLELGDMVTTELKHMAKKMC